MIVYLQVCELLLFVITLFCILSEEIIVATVDFSSPEWKPYM